MSNSNFWGLAKKRFYEITNITEHIDTMAAERSIRSNIFFKGPNVWILTFAIILASVGLNVNSTAVIIGAMLVSPLMGPIFGLGLGLGINDSQLLKDAFKNLLLMVGISLFASFIYFLLTPLKMANPTELLARTNPTIFDVFIALFGGCAGIIETCRKEKGTVFAGVAIATALMPPLCTAGFGLASGKLAYFFGALYLFIINCTFITIATYAIVKYLHFTPVAYAEAAKAKKNKNLITALIVLIIIPSIWSAFVMVKENRFDQHVEAFLTSNKTIGNNYIYDYNITHRKGSKVEVILYGETLSDARKAEFLASAEEYGIKPDQIRFTQHSIEEKRDDEQIMKTLFDRTDSELKIKDDEILRLKQQIHTIESKTIPYIDITKELTSQYEGIQEVTITRGGTVQTSAMSYSESMIVIIKSEYPLSEAEQLKMTAFLKARLLNENVVVINNSEKEAPSTEATTDNSEVTEKALVQSL